MWGAVPSTSETRQWILLGPLPCVLSPPTWYLGTYLVGGIYLGTKVSRYTISQSVLHVGDGSLIKLNILLPNLHFGDKKVRQWDMHAPA